MWTEGRPAQLQAGEQTIPGDLARLKRLVDQLVAGGYVTDTSSRQFEASYAQFNTGATKMIQGLTGMGQYLDAAVKAFHDTDAQLAASLKRKLGPLGRFYRYVLLSRKQAAGALAELAISPPRQSGEAVASAWLVSVYHPDRNRPFGYRLSVRGDGITARLDGSGPGDAVAAGTEYDVEGLRSAMLDLMTRPS